MPDKQAITIKSQGDSINILLDDSVDFEMLEETLRKKVSDAKQFFEGATANVAFKGRNLSVIEETRLLKIITTETTMKVTLVEAQEPLLISPSQAKGDAPPQLAEDAMVKETKSMMVAPSTISYNESNTAYYQGGLRSGQSIKFGGSVVIIGDVNPGSEVIAEGNVTVLGALKGMAHAGVFGDNSCYVSALVLQPTQLRIANLITYVPPAPRGKKEPQQASIAYVKDGQVFVGPL
ncbi:MAG: septum site-determining protein MinC [Defluviitaleaceae bacterium]|nr:septum site-determining protein MinC [Defluviitaleaceae bacterium]